MRSAVRMISKRITANLSYETGSHSSLAVITNNTSFDFFCSKFHRVGHDKDIAYFSPKPRLDFTGINEVRDALCLFHDMLKMRPHPSVVKFNQLLSLVVKMKHYSVALSMFGEMRSFSVPFDEYTLNISINCYCLLNHVDLGFAVMGIFLKCGFVPDTTTFNTLIRGLFLENKVAEAEKLFKKLLREKLCGPNEFTYNIVIDGLCKAGHTLTALNFLGLLEKGSCKANVIAYSTIIHSFCEDGMVDDAFQLFSKMIDNGVPHNVVTYTSMIQGLCKFGRWNDAKDLLNEMVTHQIPPDCVTYTTLIDAFCKEGKLKAAEDVLDIMRQRSVVPNIVTYNALIDGYCQEGRLDEAVCMFVEMGSCGCVPDGVTYNVFVRGFLKRNEFDKAKAFLDEMVKNGFSLDAATRRLLVIFKKTVEMEILQI